FVDPPVTHPIYLALLSIVVLVAQAILSSGPVRRLRGKDAPSAAAGGDSGVTASATGTGFVSAVKDHVEISGGSTIFLFQVARLIVIFSFVQDEGQQRVSPVSAFSKHWGKKRKGKHAMRRCARVGYFVPSHLTLARHFSVYAYRNIWPLLLSPCALLWVKIGLLAFAAIVVPLLVPRQYIPLNPKDPQKAINPEQTAPRLSMMLYTFLDPIVFLASRVPHLSHDMLPPLADYDYTRNLVQRSFKHLDTFSGSPRRHIFWGLMATFRREYIQLSILVIIRVFSTLMAPLGMNQLLQYLENHGEGSVVRPWVWVTYLFLGPAIGTMAFQWYIFISTGTVVRTTAIVTQLVFEHALRIRVKAEATSSPAATPTATPEARSEVTTPDNGSVVEINIVSEEDGGASEEPQSEPSTTAASSIKGKRKDESIGSDSSKEEGDESGSPSNLVGKMNNLVSTDLENLVDGRDFLLLFLYFPLQVVVCICAFVGMAVMIALFPIPGVVAGKIQKVQKESMKRLFGWEPKIATRLAEKREQELQYVKLRQILSLINGNIKWMVVTYVTYTAIMKRALTPSAVFSSMAVFDLLRDQLHSIFWMIPMFIQARVSIDRVNDFLHDVTVMLTDASHFDQDVIGFQNASFTWSNDDGDGTSPIPAPTSLLMALLGEMHFVPMSPDSWYHLPRAGGVSYAAQESWVQNETIRERYNKVIYQCGLQRDLSLFDAGDKTEVGEKGLTLSGGQKARVTLARAVYSSAQILILDDVLAALDVHTARWIVEKCFQGDLIRGRTVLLVTHNVAMASPLADYVVSLGQDDAIKKDKTLAKELAEGARAIKDDEKKIDGEEPNEVAKPVDGKLILAEEIAEGHVSWDAIKLFVNALGGTHPVLFWILFVGGLVVCDTVLTIQTWFMGYWAEQYDIYPAGAGQYRFVSIQSGSHHSLLITFGLSFASYLTIYGLILLVAIISYTTGSGVYVFGALRASRSIHRQLIESVLGTTLRWLDTTPTSRVITRVTQDIRACTTMLLKFLAVVYLTPIFSVPGIAIAIAIKREMSNAKAPVLGHFGASVAGLVPSIRAYGAQLAYSRAGRAFYNMNRQLADRLLGGVFAAGLAAYLIYVPRESPFLRHRWVQWPDLWWVRIFNDFERMHSYINAEQEPKPTEQAGDLRVEKLSARYSLDGPKVLHDISFHIKSGERVGVVGRTGSGKSSLTLSLLRCIFTEGSVYYDGKLTSSMNLDALRSNITIIPQIPELLSGSLRENLDPFSQYDDAALNSALRASGLFSLQSDDEDGRLTLDSQISSGGSNLSVGQRQILALARAIVRGSKLLILDEDYKTDTIIQTSLRNELKGDVTLITVAHRLQTIIDADKVMVLDAGRIVEFDKPSELLKMENGRFRSLVDESGDKDLLYSMASSAILRLARHDA
ncbi:hypothetical protein EI94DRAFT_1736769, partial [Lactarius quietus]